MQFCNIIYLSDLHAISAVYGQKKGRAIRFLVRIILGAVIMACLIDGYLNKTQDQPQAIDIYRGNTTLQITYQDSNPVDSVVVFKNK